MKETSGVQDQQTAWPGVHPHGVDWAPFAAAFIAAVAVLDSGKRAAAGLQPAGRGNGGWR
jgi:hypothetical protein